MTPKYTPNDVKAFFAWSNDALDYMVLRPLSHISLGWELTWDPDAHQYEPEDGTLAAVLNGVILDVSATMPPKRYHDHEDRLAEFAIKSLGWPLRKQHGRWVGANYDSILEQGGFRDVDQIELLNAAAGRVHAALKRGQAHFDNMENSHRKMLAAILTVIVYHRAGSPQ